jgi:hypothetical protein
MDRLRIGAIRPKAIDEDIGVADPMRGGAKSLKVDGNSIQSGRVAAL